MATRDMFSGRSWRSCAFPGARRDKLIRWFTLAAADEAFVRTSG